MWCWYFGRIPGCCWIQWRGILRKCIWGSYGRWCRWRQKGWSTDLDGRWRQSDIFREWGHKCSRPTFILGRQQWCSGWVYGQVLTYARIIQTNREGGESGSCDDNRQQQRNRWKPRKNIFQRQWGRGGDRNPEGMAGAREVSRVWALKLMVEVEARCSWYSGTEIGDASVRE